MLISKMRNKWSDIIYFQHLRLFLDNSDTGDIIQFFDSYYSHIYFIVYDSFVTAETNLRQKGAHKAQREELESVLYLVEKVLLFLPEALSQRWQYHSIGRIMAKLLHPGNSWKLLKKEAMRLFLLWYSALGEQAGDQVHAIFATLVPGFPSPYPNMGLTALAALAPEPGQYWYRVFRKEGQKRKTLLNHETFLFEQTASTTQTQETSVQKFNNFVQYQGHWVFCPNLFLFCALLNFCPKCCRGHDIVH